MSIDRDALSRVKRVYTWLAIAAAIITTMVLFFVALRSPDSIWYPLAVGFLLAGFLSFPFQYNPEKHRVLLKVIFIGTMAIALALVAYRWLAA